MKLTEREKQVVREALARRKLELYKPYPKQELFCNASLTPIAYREILLMAANQIGKCITGRTLIETVDNGLQRVDGINETFRVWAWDGERMVIALAMKPFQKEGEHECFRFEIENGRWFEAADNHRVLTSGGWKLISELLLEYALSHRQSNVVRSQSVLRLSVSRLKKIIQDLKYHYLECFYPYGGPPPVVSDNGQVFFPLRDDVRERTVCSRNLDASGNKYNNTLLKSSFRLASQGVIRRFLGRCAEFLNQDAYTPAAPNLQKPQESSQQHAAEVVAQQLKQAVAYLERHGLSLKNAFESLLCLDENRIIDVKPIGSHKVYDFTVPVYENYITAGVVHHNTYTAAALTAMHATGKYPDWYKGKRFSKAPVIWVAGRTGATVRDTIQKLLVGDIANPDTGLIPPLDVREKTPSRGVADLIDTILVKHSGGQNTRITLKYYEQGEEKFQADTVDFVWLDEEPDEKIYMEALTRTNATNGYLVMTFTPLRGLSKVVKRFTREKSPDRCVISMTIDDALHIRPEMRERIINSYARHEREARVYGQPLQGSGLIFPVSREDISCDPFPIDNVPFFWLELAGIDFAGSGEDGHPTAAVKTLYNPQDDILYVTDTYRRRGGTPMVHGAALKSWGKVPFAWPHDGLQHDKGSGVPLKDLYAAEGLFMLPDNARFEDGSNGVEAGIALMLQRMESGRLKIFSHLYDLFEEITSYYRDEGKIIKVDEDLCCALRYACMALRFAARIGRPKGMRGDYPIADFEIPTDSYNAPDYNPLGHAYIDKMLGVKK